MVCICSNDNYNLTNCMLTESLYILLKYCVHRRNHCYSSISVKCIYTRYIGCMLSKILNKYFHNRDLFCETLLALMAFLSNALFCSRVVECKLYHCILLLKHNIPNVSTNNNTCISNLLLFSFSHEHNNPALTLSASSTHPLYQPDR